MTYVTKHKEGLLLKHLSCQDVVPRFAPSGLDGDAAGDEGLHHLLRPDHHLRSARASVAVSALL